MGQYCIIVHADMQSQFAGTHAHTHARTHTRARAHVLPFSVPTFLHKQWRSQTAILTIMLRREMGIINHQQ
jgi:hypothetical protein